MLACVLLDRPDDASLRRLFAVTPVLSCRGEAVFLDLRGTERLHRGSAAVFAAIRAALAPGRPRGLALATNRFTAEIAARTGRTVAVPPGDEALFLAHLPLSMLPISDGLLRRLQPLGLRSLGDFASLPLASVERRYGAEGVAMHRLARGDDEAALVPLRPDEDLRVLALVDPPAISFADLGERLGEVVAQLAAALDERDRGVTRLRLTCRLDRARDVEADEVFGPRCEGEACEAGWEVVPASPEARAPLLLDLLAMQLERRPPAGAVTGLLLHALELQPLAVHQNGLFGEIARDASRRAEALSRLAATLGPAATRVPRVRAEHLLERRWSDDDASSSARARPAGKADVGGAVLRLLPSPEVLVPLVAGEALVGFRRGQRELRIARLSAARRLEGGWWQSAWARDEHDLVTDDGAIWRICRDMPTRRWLLLGEFD